MKLKKLIYTIILNILITFSVIVILTKFAQNSHPASSVYTLKRLEEKVTLSLKQSPEEKTDYLINLLDNRLEEMERIFKEKDYKYLLTTSLRYSSTAGQATQIITQKNLTKKSKKLKQIFKNHEPRLKEMMKKTPPKIVEVKYLQDTLNYISLYNKSLP